MEIACWQARVSERPSGKHFPAGIGIAADAPVELFYPYWVVALTASFRIPLAGRITKNIPACVDALTDGVALMPGAPPVETCAVPDERVLGALVVMNDDRLRELRASLLPFIIKRLRILAVPEITSEVIGLVHKRLLVFKARYKDTEGKLYLDTISGEWNLRPTEATGAARPATPAARTTRARR